MLSNARTQIEATLTRHIAGGMIQKLSAQHGNVALRRGVYDFVKAVFAAGSSVSASVIHWPWKAPSQLDGSNLNTQAGFGSATGAPAKHYTWWASALAVLDERRSRRTVAPWSYPKTESPQVHAALLTAHTSSGENHDNVYAHSDIPLRMIGQPWFHPAVEVTFTIATGGIFSQPYLNTFVALNSSFYGHSTPAAWGNAYLRITSGVDTGLYRVVWFDPVNTRVYLRNLDGSNYVTATTGVGGDRTGVTGLLYFRTSAYFNETGITPTSQGSVSLSGLYDPGVARLSRLLRFNFEKSGSPNPSGGAHLKGSYWFSTRPYVYGSGATRAGYPGHHDDAHSVQSVMPFGTFLTAGASASFAGGCPGLVLDETDQRLWGCCDNGTDSDLWWWRYKSVEAIHEMAASTGTPNDPVSGITMTGSRARAALLGTDRSVYFALGGTNNGLVRITTGLVASQWAAGNTNLNGAAIDKSRARSTAAGTVSTTAGTGTQTITVTGGGFTQADVGRAITLSGGSADNGTYKIAAYVSATQVTVQTLAGGAVTFTGTTNSGAMRIGDRIYLLFNDTTGWAGSTTSNINIRYMETEAWGTVLTTGDLAVTANTGRTHYDGSATATQKGYAPVAAVDPATGNLFWVSSDTAQRINRFDVTARTVSQKAISTFTAPADASGYTTPATVYCIGINPHASFREVWLGTDKGFVRFSPDHGNLSTLASLNPYAWTLPTANYRCYYGNGTTTFGAQPANFMRLDGLASSGPIVGAIWFGIDGKVWARAHANVNSYRSVYEREMDTFISGVSEVQYLTQLASYGPGIVVTSGGEMLGVAPANTTPMAHICGLPTDYQWIGGVWTPKQVIRGPIPDATSSPLCATKDLHTTADALLWGVKVAFGTGAGTDDQQFAGRMSQKQAQQTDGAWQAGTTSNWKGSNFTSSDVGRLLRVESGTQQGTYLVTAYVNATTLTVQTLGRAAYNASTEAGPLNYTLWELGSVGGGVGAETCTVVLADGIFADNTQDITNFVAETYYGKTVLSDQAEAVKVALGVVPPAGSTGVAAYFTTVTGASTVPGSPSGQALDSGSPVSQSEQLVDYCAGRVSLNGAGGRPTLAIPTATRGVDANANEATVITLDLGVDVEVGAVVVRIHGHNAVPPPQLNTENTAAGGMIANLHKANSAGGAPVQAVTGTHRRASLTGASGMGLPRSAPPTATLTSGDFLGAASVTYSDGQTTQNGNTITSAVGRFTGLTGGVVRLTSGSDLGYYRITAVDGTGAIATVRNLDQTAKAWAASATGLSFSYYADAAREDDILLAGAHRTTIEMLTSPTVARVRTYGTAAVTNGTWEVLIPTWTLAKRVSHSVQALPPDVANNGTYVDLDGTDSEPLTSGVADGNFKVVIDMSDLSTAARTGRWWKFSTIGRFVTTSAGNAPYVAGIEVYDTTGKRLLATRSNHLDVVEDQPEFMACHVTRLDWIQALYAASALVPGVNALATIGGALGNTVTLAGGAAFLPLRVFKGTTITAPGGDATVNLGGADRPFAAGDIGRIIWIQAGPNAGYWRIATTPTATSATLVNMAGTAPTLSTDATPRAWSLHEGILAGASSYDYINLGAYGEFSIAAVSTDLTTITLNDSTYLSASGLTWEVRRRAIPVAWQQTVTPAGTDAAQVARLLYSHCEAPRQPGDVVQDHKGALSFFPADVGTALTRTGDGTSTAGTGYQTFSSAGSLFTPDDVGRMLLILTGADVGPYRIRTYVSASQVTVENVRTGGQVTWTGVAGVDYKVVGERRFRASRYVTVLRQ